MDNAGGGQNAIVLATCCRLSTPTGRSAKATATPSGHPPNQGTAPYTSPYTEDEGGPQPALHTKHYLAMHQDIHYQEGMVCQDCHTSIDVHGDGHLAAANLGAVEIECSDCHGTPEAYPWELPLGYGDEFGRIAKDAAPRGTAKRLPDFVKQGTVYPAREGYLRSARGNPLTNAVRDGQRVIVYPASGKTTAGRDHFVLEPLKGMALREDFSTEGQVAMTQVRSHMGKMECYTCHAAWTPQCYGCHVKIDYSGGRTCFDWLGAGHRHASSPAYANDRSEQGYDTEIVGRIEEQRSFTRWEDPPLGFNGESRVTPVAPGCQVSVTIVGPDGKAILANNIFRSRPNEEGSGPEGQLSLDMSPTQPHTMAKRPRSCESCHLSEKALGHGIDGGRPTRPPDRRLIVDLRTVDGHILPNRTRTQLVPIAGLIGDWSRFVDADGRQLQTVGHHFHGSRPLDEREQLRLSRKGVCLSCHREIPSQSLAVSLLHHVAEFAGQIPKTPGEHDSLIHKTLLLAAWVQVGAAVGVPLAAVVGIAWYVRRRKRRHQGLKQEK